MLAERHDELLTILKEGTLKLRGEFMWGSNFTYLLRVEHPLGTLEAVYKPTRGVRPLWDFPKATLARREVAAYLVSQALGWGLVPPTVYRQNAPHGPGSLQLFIEHDPEYHYFNFSEAHRQRLRPVALFDLLINNADRKGSHILIDPQDHLWLIDHGICFHIEHKLRTVIWDFAGEPLPGDLCEDLANFRQLLDPVGNQPSPLYQSLTPYLTTGEIGALRRRADRILAQGRFTDPDPDRRPYPWPPV